MVGLSSAQGVGVFGKQLCEILASETINCKTVRLFAMAADTATMNTGIQLWKRAFVQNAVAPKSTINIIRALFAANRLQTKRGKIATAPKKAKIVTSIVAHCQNAARKPNPAWCVTRAIALEGHRRGQTNLSTAWVSRNHRPCSTRKPLGCYNNLS